ncbi:MAG: hypothetical protein JHD16_14985, partial [Solirubrobacteraceae bacterium]|nr:hypothetical protein [Solirubrobacteraceae bacterium]
MLHASNHPVRRPWRSRAGLLIAAFVAMTAVASPAATAKTVVTGSHTCVVATSGKVLCWGLNEDGQLGDGTTTKQPRPVEVVGIDDATELVSGNRSTCALRADGTVSCWGDNDLGQLGDGTAIDSPTPVTVAGLSNVVAISGDGGPLCALKGDGSVACWGYGMPGVFNGMFQWSAAPVEVSAISGAVDLSVSGHEICAIGRAATTCWTYYPGSGSSGPYGGSSGSATYSSTPVAVPNSGDIQQRSGTCSLLATGQIGCEGRNSDGELGNGIRGFYELPRGASVVKGITDARAVSGLCAVVPPGTVLCWGHPLYGGTINGGAPSPDPRTLPAPLPGLTNVRSLSGARENGCADNTAGELFCWGSNTDGRLGNGTQVPSSSPVQVA